MTAELAGLKLDDSETLRLAREAERMRELFHVMSRANVDHLEPTTHALAQGNRVREDQVEAFDAVDDLVASSPELRDGFFLIPNVL